MEDQELKEISQLQLLRRKLANSTPSLRNDQIIGLCDDYGINYSVPDVETYRLISLLAAAEQLLLKNLPEESQ